MNIRILVALHKPYNVPNGGIYIPIQVGAEGKKDLGYSKDNCGENISTKNPYYCELTAIYWAWKNLEADAIGLVHYRRYFGKKQSGEYMRDVLSEDEVRQLLKASNVILPRKNCYYIETIESHLRNHLKFYTRIDYLTILRDAVREISPDYCESLEVSLRRRSGHMCNMFIMLAPLFNSYCEWLFGVLTWVEQNYHQYTREPAMKRIYGFLAEILLDVWIRKNHVAYVEYPVISLEERGFVRKAFDLCKRKYLGIK